MQLIFNEQSFSVAEMSKLRTPGKAEGLMSSAAEQAANHQNRPSLSEPSCSRIYRFTCSSLKPTVETADPRARNCSPAVFTLQSGNRNRALPLRNPITDATAYFGGIATHR